MTSTPAERYERLRAVAQAAQDYVTYVNQGHAYWQEANERFLRLSCLLDEVRDELNHEEDAT